jgi:hypothetical protein
MSAVDRIAEALAEHVAPYFAAELAAVIAGLDDVAVVELPQSENHRDGMTVWPVHLRNRDEAFVRILHDGRIVSDGVSNPSPSAEQAARHGAALIAAARAAGDPDD